LTYIKDVAVQFFVTFFTANEYEAALTSYDKALEFKPDYHEAWYSKACYCAKIGNIEQSLENLQKAINLSPDKYLEMARTDLILMVFEKINVFKT
jgi:tetratricopeptide (TPR) repeat protein